jgi:asparaginyl-tRNA synthetase
MLLRSPPIHPPGLDAALPCPVLQTWHAPPPPFNHRQVELKATKVVHVGTTDPAEYPLAKKKQSFEFLREKAHLRPR